MGELVPKVTPEMISAGVQAFDELCDSYSPYGLVEQIYIAMRDLENSQNAFSDGAAIDVQKSKKQGNT
jgi:hypothetical protein